jgi:V8-like Glu-specific endopeptidase
MSEKGVDVGKGIKSKRVVALTIGLLLAVSVLAFPAQGTEAPDEAATQAQQIAEQLVSFEVPEAQTQAAAGYWTRDRMRRAAGLPSPEPVVNGAQELAAETPAPEGGADSSLPDPGALALAQELYTEDWKRMEASNVVPERAQAAEANGTLADIVTRSYAYPPPFTRYKAGNGRMWKHFPWKTVGRLFFTIPGQGDYSCSAGVAVRRAVWTAGHCVHTQGAGWHTNMVFVPAYKNGAAPYGVFTVNTMAALTPWVNNSNFAYDLAMVSTFDNGGMMVSQWVGNLGAIWGIGAKQHWHANGYATNLANMRYLMVCEGSLSSRANLNGPNPVGMGCDMGYGSSGGPWWIKHNPYTGGPFNLVNSVNAFFFRGQPKESFGPYFGSGARDLHGWGAAQ